MIFPMKSVALVCVLCSHGATGRLLSKGELSEKNTRRLHVGPHAPLIVTEAPSLSPTAGSFGNTPASGNSITSGGNEDSKKIPDNGGESGSSEKDGGDANADRDELPVTSSPTVSPVVDATISPQAASQTSSKSQSPSFVGDPSPAPLVPFAAPASQPLTQQSNNGIVSVLEKVVEKALDRITGGESAMPPTRAPTLSVVSAPTLYPTSINGAAKTGPCSILPRRQPKHQHPLSGNCSSNAATTNGASSPSVTSSPTLSRTLSQIGDTAPTNDRSKKGSMSKGYTAP